MTSKHFTAREMIVEVEQPGSTPIRIAGTPIKMTRTPGGVRRRSPILGEDTRAQLKHAGLSDAEIQTLIESRAALARVRPGCVPAFPSCPP